MNIVGINFESVADGEGVRVVVYVSGCLHNCNGCHNPSSHSFSAGQPFTEKLQEEIISYVRSTPFVDGITLSGGDPMYSAKELIPFVRKLKESQPSATVWIYTGFQYEEILPDHTKRSLLALCDVLVDGKFILEQRDITLPYRGSGNQRIINVQQSLEDGEIVVWRKGNNG